MLVFEKIYIHFGFLVLDFFILIVFFVIFKVQPKDGKAK